MPREFKHFALAKPLYFKPLAFQGRIYTSCVRSLSDRGRNVLRHIKLPTVWLFELSLLINSGH